MFHRQTVIDLTHQSSKAIKILTIEKVQMYPSTESMLSGKAQLFLTTYATDGILVKEHTTNKHTV